MKAYLYWLGHHDASRFLVILNERKELGSSYSLPADSCDWAESQLPIHKNVRMLLLDTFQSQYYTGLMNHTPRHRIMTKISSPLLRTPATSHDDHLPQVRGCQTLHHACSLLEACAKYTVSILKHAVFQTDDDELTPFESSLD